MNIFSILANLNGQQQPSFTSTFHTENNQMRADLVNPNVEHPGVYVSPDSSSLNGTVDSNMVRHWQYPLPPKYNELVLKPESHQETPSFSNLNPNLQSDENQNVKGPFSYAQLELSNENDRPAIRSTKF